MSEENNVNQEQPDDGVIRVDLRNFNKEVESESNEDESQAEPAEEAQPLQQHDEVEPPEDIQEPLQDNEKPSEEAQVLEEVTDEVEEKKPDEALKLEAEKYNQVEEKEEPRVELPEGLQKLVEFMNDTGGTLEDYVRLNQDVNSLDEVQLLREYYAITKPHLDKEEIDCDFSLSSFICSIKDFTCF